MIGNNAWPPRPAIGTAADHDTIGMGLRQHGAGVRGGGSIAIGNQGNADDVLNGANGAPVSPAAIELATGSSVHGDHLNARILGAARQFGRVNSSSHPSPGAS